MADKYWDKHKDYIDNPLLNISRTDTQYPAGDGSGTWRMNYGTAYSPLMDMGLSAGTYGHPNDPTYFADFYPSMDTKILPDFDKNYRTPFGNLNLYSNYDVPNQFSADFRPNDTTSAYINVLKSLLNR